MLESGANRLGERGHATPERREEHDAECDENRGHGGDPQETLAHGPRAGEPEPEGREPEAVLPQRGQGPVRPSGKRPSSLLGHDPGHDRHEPQQIRVQMAGPLDDPEGIEPHHRVKERPVLHAPEGQLHHRHNGYEPDEPEDQQGEPGAVAHESCRQDRNEGRGPVDADLVVPALADPRVPDAVGEACRGRVDVAPLRRQGAVRQEAEKVVAQQGQHQCGHRQTCESQPSRVCHRSQQKTPPAPDHQAPAQDHAGHEEGASQLRRVVLVDLLGPGRHPPSPRTGGQNEDSEQPAALVATEGGHLHRTSDTQSAGPSKLPRSTNRAGDGSLPHTAGFLLSLPPISCRRLATTT